MLRGSARGSGRGCAPEQLYALQLGPVLCCCKSEYFVGMGAPYPLTKNGKNEIYPKTNFFGPFFLLHTSWHLPAFVNGS